MPTTPNTCPVGGARYPRTIQNVQIFFDAGYYILLFLLFLLFVSAGIRNGNDIGYYYYVSGIWENFTLVTQVAPLWPAAGDVVIRCE